MKDSQNTSTYNQVTVGTSNHGNGEMIGSGTHATRNKTCTMPNHDTNPEPDEEPNTEHPDTVPVTHNNTTVTVELPLQFEYERSSSNPQQDYIRCVTTNNIEVWYFNEQEAATVGDIGKHVKRASEKPVKTLNAWAHHVIADTDR